MRASLLSIAALLLLCGAAQAQVYYGNQFLCDQFEGPDRTDELVAGYVAAWVTCSLRNENAFDVIRSYTISIDATVVASETVTLTPGFVYRSIPVTNALVLTAGPHTLTMSIDGSSSNRPFSVAAASRIIALAGAQSFGNVVTGTTHTLALTIANTGNAPLTVTSISCPAAFTSTWSGTVSPGSESNAMISFSPKSMQSYGGPLVVNSDATSGNPTNVCTGTGVASVIRLSGGLNFGNTVLTTTNVAWLTITNLGNQAFTVTGMVLSAGFSGSWTGNVAAGSATSTPIRFAPAIAQAYTGSVVVYSTALSGTNETSCTGTGIAPVRALAVAGNLGFGSVPTGTQAELTMTISNAGNISLTVNSITYPSAVFTGTWPSVVTPGAVSNASVTFRPVDMQAYGGLVTVSSDATSGLNAISCSGTGASSVIGVSGPLRFGNLTTGSQAQLTLTITNSGNMEFMVAGIGSPPGFTVGNTNDLGLDTFTKFYVDMDGHAGPTTFIDRSSVPKAVTANGGALQISCPFGRTAGFFMPADSVIVPAHADFSGLGTNSMCLETWVFMSTLGGSQYFLQLSGANAGSDYFGLQWGGTGWYVPHKIGNALQYIVQTPDPGMTANAWHHVCVVRNGSTWQIYRDGNPVGSPATYTGDLGNLTGAMNIGGVSGLGLNAGWLKETRLSNVARYTNSFAPATTPFAPDGNTKLLMHYDSPASSPIGPAIYFDGVGDYLSVPDDPDWDVGTNNFTLECWALFDANQFSGLMDMGDGVAGAGVTMFYHSQDGNFENRINGASYARGYPWVPTPNRWYHLAFVRNNGFATMYADGRPLGPAQASAHNVSVSAPCVIGRWNANSLYMHKGAMREIRISKVARYTAAFSPSQDGFAPDGNTVLYIKGSETNGCPNVLFNAMTSNTSPAPYVVSASSVSGGLDAWRAIEGNDANGNQWQAGGVGTQWLKFDCGAPVVIRGYNLLGNPYQASNSPRDFQLQGSDTGAFAGEETVLDSQTNQVTSTSNKRSYWFHNSRAFRYYRLYITAIDSSTSYVVACWELYRDAPSDSSASPKLVSVVGDAKIKYGEDYRSGIFKDEAGKYPVAQGGAKVDFFSLGEGSGLFDGSGDYLSVADSVDWDFGTGDFWLECYVRLSALGTYHFINRASGQFNLSYHSGNVRLGVGGAYLNGAATPAINQWYHLAAGRSGGTTRVFLNGTILNTGVDTSNIQGSDGLIIGGYDAATYCVNGLLDNVQVVKGVARSSSTFTPGALSIGANRHRLAAFSATNLPVTFAPTTEGVNQGTIVVSNSAMAGNGQIACAGVGVGSTYGYEAWIAAVTNGVTNYNESAAADGYQNLLKYATGSSPTDDDGLAAMRWTSGAGRLVGVTLNRNTNAADVTFIVEGSGQLTDDSGWVGIATNALGSWGGATNVVESGTGNPLSVSVGDVVPPTSNRFLRLRVTRP